MRGGGIIYDVFTHSIFGPFFGIDAKNDRHF